MEAIPGIWYEMPRNRWRVKLCKDGEIYHRSYHRSFDDALVAWTAAKQQALRAVLPTIDERHLSPVAKFIRQPPPGNWRIRL